MLPGVPYTHNQLFFINCAQVMSLIYTHQNELSETGKLYRVGNIVSCTIDQQFKDWLLLKINKYIFICTS